MQLPPSLTVNSLALLKVKRFSYF